MGATHSFVRNDEIDGQGKEILSFANRIQINKRELDRIYHEFNKYEDPKTHHIELKTFFQHCHVELKLIETLLFQIFDEIKTFQLTFFDFLVYLWNFLASSDEDLMRMCFMLFDIGNRKYLDFTEVEYLIQTIWSYHPSKAVVKGMKKLEQNQDGTVTLEEFELLCKHYPEILSPLIETRRVFRLKIIFPRFWKELTVRRKETFQSLNILEIRGVIGPDAVDYAHVSMEYLNLRLEDVPYQFIEQWRTTQRKKEHSYQGNVELSYELFEGKEEPPPNHGNDDDLSTIF